MRTPITQNFTKRLTMVTSNIMFAGGWFESINDMFRLLFPIRLRQVIFCKEGVYSKLQEWQKKKSVQIYDKKKTFQIIKHTRKHYQQISG